MKTFFLIRALKSGDVKSLERVYKLYYSKLYNFSQRFHSSTMDSDDFVQQTFLKVWENRNQLKDDVTLDQQIFVICKNLILNHLKRESRIISELKEDYLSPEPQDENIFTTFSLKLDRLHRIMERLPSKRKNVFILHKIDNLSYTEISQALGISKKTIANHIYLAHNFIKEELHK
ncbi:sigma-70 family RNA polymerase sigma factor [Zunongwangia sp. F260]|uniref:Sigma-70 family RNA polymerase sigma factor n=1 Tax=Autumnicola lenta TaxID=3075593 RepID=A0ABU3CGK7_9FLAO|nr:sigma-70 family RNA polymerase sigma factor [Zunongwangia sp. F260]MDT0645372.1 sigma-70 family RNA polymerase sigma factor [Zunongwangia sp. F260]